MWSDNEVNKISDVFFICIKHGEGHYIDRLNNHHLKYVINGMMKVFDGSKEIQVAAGQSIFLRKDHRIRLRKFPLDDEEFRCITFEFKRDFLRKFFQESGGAIQKVKAKDSFTSSSILLTEIPAIKSLFLSMTPYLESETEPTEAIMQLKLREGIQTLLDIDERFYPTLFDFADTWKIDILDFLEENYRYDLSMAEIANYTGRSLSTLKRDFAKISELSPEKWIINKRLDTAYKLLEHEGKSVSEIMDAVGFKNRSHFTKAFKQKFGILPSEKITKIR